MRKLLLVGLLCGCGLDPAAGLDDGLSPVEVRPGLQVVGPRDSGVWTLPPPSCRPVSVETCFLYTDGGELCVTEDAGCL